MEGVISPCVLSAKKDSPSVVRVKRQGVSSWGGMNTGLAGKRVLSLFLGLFLCMSVFCICVCAPLACMYGHHLPAQCPGVQKRVGVRLVRVGVMAGHLIWLLETKLVLFSRGTRTLSHVSSSSILSLSN